MKNIEHHVGDLTIVKVWELDLNGFSANKLLPDLTPAALALEPDPRIFDAKSEKIFLSVHSYVIRGGGRTILIDTGAGNDKIRPSLNVLDHLHSNYLERLATIGVRPEDVDTILLTHLHADHVGWNTRLQNGVWVPTFPNATVICSGLEWRYGEALAAKDDKRIEAARIEAEMGVPVRTPVAGVFADSLAPIEAAGLLRQIRVDGNEVLPGIRFLATPGHSIDHSAISVTSRSKEALFGGDVLHHPFEIANPQLVSMFCEFPVAARRSRHWLLEHAARNDSLYFSSHFPASSVGRISREPNGYLWRFLED